MPKHPVAPPLCRTQCNNGQAAFWYSQGCFIGCPTCDHMSGRRQTDLCGLGFKVRAGPPVLACASRGALLLELRPAAWPHSRALPSALLSCEDRALTRQT